MSDGTTPSPEPTDDTVAFDAGPSTPPPAPTPPAPGPVAEEPPAAPGEGSTPWRARPATPGRPTADAPGADAATERGPIGPTGPGGPGGPPPRSGGSSSNALTIVAVGGVVVLVVVILLMAVVLGGDDDGEEVSTSDSTTTSTTASTTSSTTAPTTAPTTPSTAPPATDPQLPGVTIVVNDDGDELEPGLLCAQLFEDGADYDAAVAYWLREGRPTRMDEDGNGIPCETVFPEEDVAAFWGSQDTAEEGVEPDLLCADLDEQGLDYGAAVAYWEEQGRPDRMDDDGDGVPCETVYPAEDVEAYWGTSAG